MAFGLTSAIVAEYASKPFVRAALADPFRPASVLSFHLGFDFKDKQLRDAELREGSLFERMSPFWYGGHPDYDELCRSFSDVVRAAGTGRLTNLSSSSSYSAKECDADWDTVDGKIARMVLCDQLSRNCFRGTDEAFKYDEEAVRLARNIALAALEQNDDSNRPEVEEAAKSNGNKIYGTYACLCVLPFMHSENLSDHEMCVQLIEWGKTKSSKIDWDGQVLSFELEHKAVVERFGRYPHRNEKMGRVSTQEEIDWLNDVENLPGWAKSQG